MEISVAILSICFNFSAERAAKKREGSAIYGNRPCKVNYYQMSPVRVSHMTSFFQLKLFLRDERKLDFKIFFSFF